MAEPQVLEAPEFCLESISVSGYSRQDLASLVVVLSTRADVTSPLKPVTSVHSAQGIELQLSCIISQLSHVSCNHVSKNLLRADTFIQAF